MARERTEGRMACADCGVPVTAGEGCPECGSTEVRVRL